MMNGLDSGFAAGVLFFVVMFFLCLIAGAVNVQEEQNRKYDKALEMIYGRSKR